MSERWSGWLRTAAAAMSCCLALSLSETALAEAPPNIVYILADDLGWKDVGFHGGAIRTPNLDRLAAEGAVLNALYAQPFSTQTHAALMTGRYPMRYGLQTMSIMPANTFGLPVEERTLGQALKQAGYATAFIGKWQLGHAQREFWPTHRGFDYFYGSLSGHVDTVLKKSSKTDWRRNENLVRDEGYVNTLIAADAVRVIERHDRARPLFLMVSFPTPAAFAGTPKELVDQQRDIQEPNRRKYAAAVGALDRGVGEVIASLERRKLMDNTLIVFHSDGGGALPTKYPVGDGDVDDFAADNGIYRGGKGSVYEGGVRVVAALWWPDKIKPKTTVVQFFHVTDLFPMLLKLAGASLEQPKKLDGIDMWPVVAQGQLSERKQVLLNVEDFRGAVRIGEWKLIVHAALPAKVELFNVANDPEEAENAAAKYPERTKELMGVLTDYAYDMAPSKYLEELATVEAGKRPLVWRQNPVVR